jgi:hypothetical protein
MSDRVCRLIQTTWERKPVQLLIRAAVEETEE